MFRKILFIIFLAFFISPNFLLARENIFYYFNNVNGLNSYTKNAKQIDILAPQIYTVDFGFKIIEPNTKERKLLKEAKKKKTEIMPLLVQKSFDKVLMSDILISPQGQDKIINFLIKEAKKQGYVGWQYDFENINHLDRDLYTQFVAKTYQKLKAENLKFSVAVVVRSNDYNPESKNQDWSSAYDYKKLAENSDFLSLMTYDDPYSIGPVASLPYVNRILDYMLQQAPPEKLSLGIPAYCWQWQNGKRTNSTTYELASKAYRNADKKTRENKFYDYFGSENFRFVRDGVVHDIWCDSQKSFEMKNKIIEERGLRGFSVWALGQEDKNIWKYLKKNSSKK
jgi:spore germination protein YaaH